MADAKEDWIRDGRQIFSMVLGILLANAITWIGGRPYWYYLFPAEALIFAGVFLTIAILRRTRFKESVDRQQVDSAFKQGTSWVIGVLLGSLLTIEVNTVQTPANLQGVNLLWALMLSVAILLGAVSMIRLDRILKTSGQPPNR